MSRPPPPEDADLIILNTCHIREKAAEKVYSELGRLRRLKEDAAAAGRNLTIAVAGCVAQAEGGEIVRRAPAVDVVVGSQNYHHLPDLIARAEREGHAVDTEFPVDDKFDHLAAPSRAAMRGRGVTAFVTVQEGCDKFCTFCVVPYTRGAETSRAGRTKSVPRSSGLPTPACAKSRSSARTSMPITARDPTGRPWSLARLAANVSPDIRGIERLRYTTSHPLDMADDLIAAHRDLPVLMPQLHLPVQSGSDRILAAMNRRHTRADYLDVIARLRECAAGYGAHVGFHRRLSGRDGRRLRRNAALVEEIGYSGAFSFKYSPRPGTRGAEMTDQVDEAVKSDRLAPLAACHRSPASGLQSPLCSAAPSTCCSSARAVIPARSSAARPISSQYKSKRRLR